MASVSIISLRFKNPLRQIWSLDRLPFDLSYLMGLALEHLHVDTIYLQLASFSPLATHDTRNERYASQTRRNRKSQIRRKSNYSFLQIQRSVSVIIHITYTCVYISGKLHRQRNSLSLSLPVSHAFSSWQNVFNYNNTWNTKGKYRWEFVAAFRKAYFRLVKRVLFRSRLYVILLPFSFIHENPTNERMIAFYRYDLAIVDSEKMANRTEYA